MLYNACMAGIAFTKMHGLGNDFIVLDDAAGVHDWAALGLLAQRYCPRRTGVGADGVIAVGHGPLAGERWPAGVDFEMRYVNADGSRAEMCGNGIRCLGQFVAGQLNWELDSVAVLTGAGVLSLRLSRDAAGVVQAVTVGMGVPRLVASQIPTTLRPDTEPVVGALLDLDEDEPLLLTAVNMGNPHAVFFVDAISDHHVHALGPLIETHPLFPQKINAEFVQVLTPQRLRMRVWERGVGETWACGTGACASVVAAVLNGHCAHGTDVTVVLNGGELTVNWPAADEQVLMTGPAAAVFHGELEL